MSKVFSIKDILSGIIKINSIIEVRGWVKTRRDSKIGISFVNIYDGSCIHTLQAIIHNSLKNYDKEVLHLTSGCSVIIIGKVVLSINKLQKFEIQVTKIDVIGWIKNPDKYPITSKKHSVEYLREVAHLRPRTNIIGAMIRIRHTLSYFVHKFFYKKNYFWVSTPLITSSNTEGSGDMFRVSTLDIINDKQDYKKDFFGKETFLTVSGQLNAEAYASALSKIYTFGPTFRAENSNTSRHLAEFWMIEPEIAFANLNDLILLVQQMLKYLFKKILKENFDDINFFYRKVDKNIFLRLEQFIKKEMIIINYGDAIKILKKFEKIFSKKIFWGIDLSTEHERFLSEKYFKSPLIIKNYPKNIKAFYMRINDDNKTVASMDLLVPNIGELLGGSEREERLEILKLRLKEIGLNKKNYDWYIDLRRYGTVFHAGFGLGFERLISYVTGIKNIKDVIPFPRTPNNIKF